MEVIVVGGGWAGLAAAVDLARHGAQVTLLEAAAHLGGRARSVHHQGLTHDNGQHLLLGAYRDTLALLQRLEVDCTAVFARHPLDLVMWDARAHLAARLRCPPLPAPLHATVGLGRMEGVGMADRLSALRLAGQIMLGLTPPPHLTAAAWLQRHGQGPDITTRLWEPLCLAALTTPSHAASAQVLARVLGHTFAGDSAASDLLIPRQPLGAVLPEPAARFIQRHHGQVLTQQRVTALCLKGETVTGVETAQRSFVAEHVVLAVPPVSLARLLTPHASLQTLGTRVSQLSHEPIATVYVDYPAGTTLPLGPGMMGLLGTTTQWLFDHAALGRAGRIAAVISADHSPAMRSNATLGAQVTRELARAFPHWPPPLRMRVLCEQRAALHCSPHNESLRPPTATSVRGLWLAGDYTATGYPSTLEGAVRSGQMAARAVLKEALS